MQWLFHRWALGGGFSLLFTTRPQVTVPTFDFKGNARERERKTKNRESER